MDCDPSSLLAFQRDMWLRGCTLKEITIHEGVHFVTLSVNEDERTFHCTELLGPPPVAGARYSALVIDDATLCLLPLQE